MTTVSGVSAFENILREASHADSHDCALRACGVWSEPAAWPAARNVDVAPAREMPAHSDNLPIWGAETAESPRKSLSAVGCILGLPHEASPLLLRPQRHHHRQKQDVCNLERRQRPRVPKPVTQRILDVIGRSREQDSQLIREARHQSPNCIRGEFIQVGWNDSPGPLHAHLHQEGAQGEGHQRSSKRPHGNHGQREKNAIRMVRLRPKVSDKYPKANEPSTAPTLYKMAT